MQHLSARTNLLDASALVKLVVIEEERSDKLRRYLATESSWYTTPFCFYEALGVLKVQHYYRHTLTEQQFRDASFHLMAEFRATPNVHDLDLTDPSLFVLVQEIAKTHTIDLSDAFQIASIVKGCPLAGDSKTVLVTDDKKLARAARAQNCKVWYLPDDPPA
jgi:predicted nucleic acid-binding protein